MTDQTNHKPADVDVDQARALGPAAQWRLLGSWGLITALTFPRPNFWIFAYVSLTLLLLVVLKGAKTWRTLGTVYLGTSIWWVLMLAWLIPVTIPGWLVLGVYCASFTTLFAWAVRRVTSTWPVPFFICVPVLYTSVEWLRGSIMLGGFPWFHLGNSQPTWMIQIADLGSFYAVGFVVAAVNGLILDLLLRPLVMGKGSEGKRRWSATVRWGLPTVGVMLVGTLAYGALRTQQLDQAAQSARVIRVAIVQTNVPQSNKDSSSWDQLKINFDQMMVLAETAASHDPKPHLIVCPETMVPRAINDSTVKRNERAQNLRRTLADFCVRHRVHLMVGAHAWEDWAPVPEHPEYALPKRRHNAAYCLGPDGKIIGRYDKMHLVPFGEYIPGTEALPFLKGLLKSLTPYRDEYTLKRGREAAVMELALGGEDGRWVVAPPICFEDLVTDVPRMMVWSDGRKRTDLLVNLTNDGWYAGSAQGPQHEQMARFRCVENRVPMVRSVNTGISGFIDSAGRMVGRVDVDGQQQQVEGVAHRILVADERASLFGRIGIWPVVLCSFLGGTMLGLSFVPRLRRRP